MASFNAYSDRNFMRETSEADLNLHDVYEQVRTDK